MDSRVSRDASNEDNSIDASLWDLLRFCRGYRSSKIHVYVVFNNRGLERRLSHWKGETRLAKLEGVIADFKSGVFSRVLFIVTSAEDKLYEYSLC